MNDHQSIQATEPRTRARAKDKITLQGSETFQGSGTGDLSGLRGDGGFEGDFGKASEGILDYWFE